MAAGTGGTFTIGKARRAAGIAPGSPSASPLNRRNSLPENTAQLAAPATAFRATFSGSCAGRTGTELAQ